MARRRKEQGGAGRASRTTGASGSARIIAEIRTARRKAGLTQRELAARLKKSPSWIARVETGERSLMVHDLQDIADALGVDALELLARAMGAPR